MTMDISNDDHRHPPPQQAYDLLPPPLPAPPPPFADFHFTFTSGSMPVPTFADLQHSHSLLGLPDPHSFDFNFGGAPLGPPPPEIGADDAGITPFLLSSAEENNVLGFLDQLSGDAFDLGPSIPGLSDFPTPGPMHDHGPPGPSSEHDHSNPYHVNGGLGLDVQMHHASSTNAASSGTGHHHHHVTPTTISPHETTSIPFPSAASTQPPNNNTRSSPTDVDPSPRPAKRRKSSTADSSLRDSEPPTTTTMSAAQLKASRKPLLTEPQKRWNHIQSEQRRRTVIKENFSTLETLVAADKAYTGPNPSLPIPLDANGKPKRGVKAKSLRGKGKMGTLFRAAEYITHLEAVLGDLSIEVERIEAVAAPYRQGHMQVHHQDSDGMAGIQYRHS